MKRKLTTLEKNYLLKNGITDFDLEAGIPVEYVGGLAQFHGRDFLVSKDVLIPRIESEEIIDLVLTLRNKNNRVCRILDVGTGSGCIGITLFLELKKLQSSPRLTCIDISKEALQITEKNLKRFSIAKKTVKLCLSNILANLDSEQRFDFIIANLPYIPSSRIVKLDKSVRDFEPRLALDGGPDGLNIINKLLKQADSHLQSQGYLILEIDADHQISDFSRFSRRYKLVIKKDQFNRRRFLIAQLISASNQEDRQLTRQ